ncbi:unnamed protein product [Cyclocybe aegerita]|uniref:Integrase core domain-containing protein n=1 Tax=Cyclocybe aegerita TaxID=1973307 RepID=A0A8S0XIG7_CYCAE|nr:unnamed protein product [Cyclocybe aegerita]
MFLDAVVENGVPSHGSSVFNTRIERLWVEVGQQFACQWCVFFLQLERDHQLDCTDPTHLWLVQHLFLAAINDDCTQFKHTWNVHPISGEGHHNSPNVLEFLGMLDAGYYDECEGLTLEEITEYYGCYGGTVLGGPDEGSAEEEVDSDSNDDSARGGDLASMDEEEDDEQRKPMDISDEDQQSGSSERDSDAISGDEDRPMDEGGDQDDGQDDLDAEGEVLMDLDDFPDGLPPEQEPDLDAIIHEES